MYRTGHVGAALLAYAPLGALAVPLGSTDLALAGAGVAAALAMLPDADVRIPFVAHRGPTHTVWFAALVAVLAGALGGLAAAQRGVPSALALGGFVGVVAAVTVLSHLLADVVTPMGIRPFAPRSRRWYSLDVVPSKNPTANYALFVAGLAATAASLSAGAWLEALFA